MVENKYKVYVCCNTYNHAAYITDALNGFVMQETNFPFVVCVIDDASTDGEQDVIRQYVNKNFDTDNPDVAYQRETDYAEITFTQHKTNKNCFLVVHYLKYNHYQHNISMRSYLDEWRNDSEYIALCEGDDYWTDPLKLQKQVEVLEKYDNVSIVFNRVEAVSRDSVPLGWTIPNIKAKLFEKVSMKDYIEEEFYKGRWTFHTSSVMYRRDIQGLELARVNEYKLFPHVDMVLMLFYLSKGSGFYFQDCCGCYRVFSGGYNSNLIKDREYKILESKRKISALLSLNEHTNRKYSKLIKRGILRQEYDLDVYLNGKLVIFKPKYFGILIGRILQL